MGERAKSKRKFFTVEQANRALPLVRAIVSDLAPLWQDVLQRQQRLAHLLADRQLEMGDPYGDELADMQQALELDAERVRSYIEELHEIGVEAKGPEGLVDFPARLDDRPVCLCWKLGESEVLFWHEVDAGFAGRQPLTAAAAPEDGASGGEKSYGV
jgi:hypothetical protein